MVSRTKALRTGIIGIVAAMGVLALTIYPFSYGFAESVLLAGSFVLVALYRTLLDDAL